METIDITKLTTEQRKELFAQVEAEQKRAEEQKQAEKDTYDDLVSGLVNEVIPRLHNISNELSQTKMWVFKQFEAVLDLKFELWDHKTKQKSHTFSNKAGTARITIGYDANEKFKDTADVGIAMIEEWMVQQAKDESKRMLIGIVREFLIRNKNGDLDARKIQKLKKDAVKYNEHFLTQALNIIQDASYEEFSQYYIRAMFKTKSGKWSNISLSVSDVDFPEGFEVKF